MFNQDIVILVGEIFNIIAEIYMAGIIKKLWGIKNEHKDTRLQYLYKLSACGVFNLINIF